MVNEAAEHEAEDKQRREEIERRNKLDNLCYTLEKTITENKDKLPEGDVSTLTGLIAEARSSIEKQDDAGVTASLEKLEKEAHRIASVMYEKAGPQGGPPADGEGGAPEAPSGGKSKGKDGVIDAEFGRDPVVLSEGAVPRKTPPARVALGGRGFLFPADLVGNRHCGS